ncbi:MAG: hypothetical protein IJ774_08325 [Selenomonadaceae bacterium]|nr:hypothetical protein [Selenomonadaceae bacterium]
MSYDANSPQARKGKIGEQIVKHFVEALGWSCEKPDGVTEDTPTHIARPTQSATAWRYKT